MKYSENQIKAFERYTHNSERGLNYGTLAAQVLSDYANGKTETKEFAEEITSATHRYLQGVIFKEFVAVIRAWAKCYDSGKYDPRNEFAVKTSKVLCDSYLGYEGAYDNALYDKIKKL